MLQNRRGEFLSAAYYGSGGPPSHGVPPLRKALVVRALLSEGVKKSIAIRGRRAKKACPCPRLFNFNSFRVENRSRRCG